jgi:hypothetical protein
MSLDTGTTSSSFDPKGSADGATREVRKRFLHEVRNEGVRGASRNMDIRNGQRDEAKRRAFDNRQMGIVSNHSSGRLTASAVRAAGTRTSTATIDGVKGLFTQEFRDGLVVREEFKAF